MTSGAFRRSREIPAVTSLCENRNIGPDYNDFLM
jgi:hypothetical protein